ncbi:MAG: hypothetical protein HY702_02660 [Gemmatimonadetes bacterium]|nr:hypothetical protein [Gemmatimonadota bacterium]
MRSRLLVIGTMMASASPSPAQIQRVTVPDSQSFWLGIGATGIQVHPLPWYNDRDGFVSGVHVRRGDDRTGSMWLTLAQGWREPDRGPSVAEAGLQRGAFTAWFKYAEGRRGFGTSYALELRDRWTLTVGAEETALIEDAYLRRIFFFACPADAPAAPCDSVRAPLAWSSGRDRALEAQLAAESPERSLAWSFAVRLGLPLLGGRHDYLQARAEAVWMQSRGGSSLEVRAAAAWTEIETPLQSRFFAHGSGPLSRWENPYLRSRGAPLDRIRYFDPGGAHLRAYGRTTPLLRRFVGVAARGGREFDVFGLPGFVYAFAEGAWMPAAPKNVGRASITPDASVLLDWPRLTFAEERGGGRFNAGALRIPDFLADAGIGAAARLPLGFYLDVSVPVWASEGSLADRARGLFDLAGESRDRALGVRYAISLGYSPSGAPRRVAAPGAFRGGLRGF